ncbi:MAG: protein jag [Christensenellaceae bacterium]|nr:protein jag [Christensenellaceae bacterium]
MAKNITSIESSAKTVEEAIALGLEKLGVCIAEVDIEVLEEGSKGLFGFFGSKMANVKLTLKATQTAQEMLDSLNIDKTRNAIHSDTKHSKEVAKNNKLADEQKVKEAEPIKVEEPVVETVINEDEEETFVVDDEIIKELYNYISQLTKMMGVDVDINITVRDNNTLYVDMQGDTLGILIGRRGETLDALQYITSLAINKNKEGFIRVLLDSENYRAKREESLVRLANRMANKAVKTGRRVVMEPMNPYERRILHSALQGNEHVTTHSEGEEPRRHLVITLKK